MSRNGLQTVADTAEMIARGRVLLLAGDETLLAQLPNGTWIGGTATSFMTEDGGVTDNTRIFVTDVTDIADHVTIKRYTTDELQAISADYPASGFSILIMPAGSDIHARFAKEVQDYPGVFNSPLLGWVSAVDVSAIGKRQPKVFAGTAEAIADRAVALHASLKSGKVAHLDIINLFKPGEGDVITFDQQGLSCITGCSISGKPASLAQYIRERGIDTKLPLVADYNGAMINVSLQSVDATTGEVRFYAPVFPGVEYRFARPIANYAQEFERFDQNTATVFSCNCILNFLYAELEGKKTGTFSGPVTFGEIAYMLLNQTLVYLAVVDAA